MGCCDAKLELNGLGKSEMHGERRDGGDNSQCGVNRVHSCLFKPSLRQDASQLESGLKAESAGCKHKLAGGVDTPTCKGLGAGDWVDPG